MTALITTLGLPGSGKTTWARESARSSKGRTKLVSKDDLRSLLDDGVWSRQNEKMIVKAQDAIISMYLDGGFNVICHNTNFGWEQHFRDLAKKHGADFVLKDFTDVPLETCIERDLKRLNSVGKDVIVRMYDQYLRPAPEVYEFTPGLRNAVQADLDGTLAHLAPGPDGSTRNIYDGSRVKEDRLDEAVAGILRVESAAGRQIVLMSGRDEKYRDVTEAWLRAKAVPFDALYMRPEGDTRKDSIVKRELFDAHVRPHWNVLYILDDRQQVVDEFRAMGLKVCQVAPGDF